MVDTADVVRMLPVAKIYADPVFNSRGTIAPMDVIDLAKSIEQDGLLQPIVVRPRTKDTPEGFDYTVIVGHRRHKAFQVNNNPIIPAIIKQCDDLKARTLNLIENVKRHALNIMQEAKNLRYYYDAGWSRDEIAQELGVSSTWVQIRVMLLELPAELQEAAASGIFTQQQIRDLHGLKNKDSQVFAAKKLKEAKARGESASVEAKLKHGTNPNAKHSRKKNEIFLMQDEFQRACGNNLATRALAWAAGEITDLEIYQSLKDHCDTEGLPYSMPDFDEVSARVAV